MNSRKFERHAGFLVILGAVLGIAVNIARMNTSDSFSLSIRVGGAFAFLLLLIGLVGFARSGAAGDLSFGRMGIGLALIGQALTIPYELFQPDLLYPALGIAAGLLIGIGMLLSGVAVLQANQWQTWRKFTPIIYGLYPLVLVFIYPLLESLALWSESGNQVLTIMALACWLPLGLAMQAEATHTGKSTHYSQEISSV